MRLKEPPLFGKIIHLSTEIKYTGLTFDKGLTWKEQMYKVPNKA